MRDLKHLIYFENLLQEANNDLVKQAKSDGKLALGYTCYFMPEVLLDLPGCFSVRLRAPRCTSPDMATYYMSSRTCHYGRSLLERALEGGFNFLDAQLATETCTVTCRFQEHLQRMDIIQNERFKCEFMDVPFKKTENSIDHYEAQIKAHVLDFLHDNYGVDTSDEALRQTIESHNELCRIMQAIGDHRKLDVPTITGYEYHVINLVTLACPKYLIIDKLRETLEELKTREPDARLQYRCKVLLAGSENDDPDFTKLIESCGALVVADRYCYGGMESRLPIEIREGRRRCVPSPATICSPASAPALWSSMRCASASSTSPTWQRRTRRTASSWPPTSSASTGAMSVSSIPSFSSATSAILSVPSRRSISTRPAASCVPGSRRSLRAWRSRRSRRA